MLVLAGASQSAWCVNTFVAEGFNVDPGSGTGVYDGAFAYLSGGNWLAINRWGDDGAAAGPVRPARTASRCRRRTCSPGRGPTRSSSRSPATPTTTACAPAARPTRPLPARARHYDFPSPHAPGTVVPRRRGVRAARVQRRPGGADEPDRRRSRGPGHAARVVPARSARPRCPTSVPALAAVGVLRPSGPRRRRASTSTRSRAWSCGCRVVDADAQPVGGVRFPDVELPLGRAEPVALSPCGTASIDDVCGNFGGWQPFAPDELEARYGDRRRVPRPLRAGVRRAGRRRVRVGVGAGAGARRRPARLRGGDQPAAVSGRAPTGCCWACSISPLPTGEQLVELRPGRGSRRASRPSPARWAGRGPGCRRSGP